MMMGGINNATYAYKPLGQPDRDRCFYKAPLGWALPVPMHMIRMLDMI